MPHALCLVLLSLLQHRVALRDLIRKRRIFWSDCHAEFPDGIQLGPSGSPRSQSNSVTRLQIAILRLPSLVRSGTICLCTWAPSSPSPSPAADLSGRTDGDELALSKDAAARQRCRVTSLCQAATTALPPRDITQAAAAAAAGARTMITLAGKRSIRKGRKAARVTTEVSGLRNSRERQ